MRGIIGLAVGFSIMLLTRVLPDDNLTVQICGLICLAIAAGFVTALVAGNNEFRSAGILGIVMVAMAVASMRGRGAAQPGWEEMALGGCGPIGAFLGTALRLLVKRPLRS